MKKVKIATAVTLVGAALVVAVAANAPAVAQSQGAVVITQGYCQIQTNGGFYTGTSTIREKQGDVRASCTAVLAGGTAAKGKETLSLPGWAGGESVTCKVILHKSGRATASCSN